MLEVRAIELTDARIVDAVIPSANGAVASSQAKST
jgi:hypothetical protein